MGTSCAHARFGAHTSPVKKLLQLTALVWRLFLSWQKTSRLSQRMTIISLAAAIGHLAMKSKLEHVSSKEDKRQSKSTANSGYREGIKKLTMNNSRSLGYR